MKKLIGKLFLSIILLSLLMFNSCKRDKTPDDSASAEDYANIFSSLDVTADDITAASGQVTGISGKTDGWQALCGAASVDTGTGHQIIITYDGTTPCKGIARSGQVTVSLLPGLRWILPHAVVAIVYSNLTFTNTVTGAYYILNGNDTIINETGGLAWRIMEGITSNAAVRHRQHSTNLNITFSNGTQRIWSQDRSKIYSSTANGAQDIITQTIFSENSGSIDMWGTTQAGDNFTNTIVDSIKANNYTPSCLWRPYSGEDIQKIGNGSVDILFGVDQNGNPVGSATGCTYGYKITYSKGNKILTKVIPYIF